MKKTLYRGCGVKSVLVSWIGQNDLNAISEDPEKRQSHGPVLATLEKRDYTKLKTKELLDLKENIEEIFNNATSMSINSGHIEKGDIFDREARIYLKSF